MTQPSSPIPRAIKVVRPQEVVQYTDPGQFDYFKGRINTAFGRDCRVRFDSDQTTIVFLDDNRIRLGDWLLDGQQPVTEEQVRFHLRPVPDWLPDDAATPTEEKRP